MTTTQTPATDAVARIVELARNVGGMLDDAYTNRTDNYDCSQCGAQADDERCGSHAEDLQVANGWEQAVIALQQEATWAARDAEALDALADVVRGTTAAGASAAELLSRVATVVAGAGRQVSPTTD